MDIFKYDNIYTETLRNVLIMIAALTVVGFVLKWIAGRKNKFEKIAVLLLKLATVGAVGVFFYFTVFNRGPHTERGGNLTPFYSYVQIIKKMKPDYMGDDFYVTILNYALTYPLGFFLCLSHDRVKIVKTTLILAVCSILAEALQFIFALGFYELDDVINNVLGGMFGYLVATGFKKVIKLRS